MSKAEIQAEINKKKKQIELIKVVLSGVRKFQEKKNVKNDEKRLGELGNILNEL